MRALLCTLLSALCLNLCTTLVGLREPPCAYPAAALLFFPCAGDVAKLSLPDRFIKEVVLQVPLITTRLAVMEFKLVLDELLETAEEKLRRVDAATTEITSSTRLATLLLDVILPVGNTLNSMSKKGVAAGFKMSSLNKLMQTKAASGETFLRFIAEGLLDRSPKLLHVSEDFPVLLVSRSSDVVLTVCHDNLAKLQKGMRHVETLQNKAQYVVRTPHRIACDVQCH
ncbi:MAG: hypothetical protein EOO65_02320 [Methanosarcinales archaeon]|nr:MAG: hypothetical protein EOO65_02320 [Methanosarcinales archaeon]